MNLDAALTTMRDTDRPTAERIAAADLLADSILRGDAAPAGADASALLDECCDLVEDAGALFVL